MTTTTTTTTTDKSRDGARTSTAAGLASDEDTKRKSAKQHRARRATTTAVGSDPGSGAESANEAPRRKSAVLPKTNLEAVPPAPRADEGPVARRRGPSSLSRNSSESEKSASRKPTRRKSSEARAVSSSSLSNSTLSTEEDDPPKQMRRSASVDSKLGDSAKTGRLLTRSSDDPISSRASQKSHRQLSGGVASSSAGLLSEPLRASPTHMQERRQSTPAAVINHAELRNAKGSHAPARRSKPSKSRPLNDIPERSSAGGEETDEDVLIDPVPRKRASSATASMSSTFERAAGQRKTVTRFDTVPEITDNSKAGHHATKSTGRALDLDVYTKGSESDDSHDMASDLNSEGLVDDVRSTSGSGSSRRRRSKEGTKRTHRGDFTDAAHSTSAGEGDEKEKIAASSLSRRKSGLQNHSSRNSSDGNSKSQTAKVSSSSSTSSSRSSKGSTKGRKGDETQTLGDEESVEHAPAQDESQKPSRAPSPLIDSLLMAKSATAQPTHERRQSSHSSKNSRRHNKQHQRQGDDDDEEEEEDVAVASAAEGDIDYQGGDEDEDESADEECIALESLTSGDETDSTLGERSTKGHSSKMSLTTASASSGSLRASEETKVLSKSKSKTKASEPYREPEQPINLVSVITELVVDTQDVGFDFLVMGDGTLELSGLDYELFQESLPDIESLIEEGNRIVYIGKRSFAALDNSGETIALVKPDEDNEDEQSAEHMDYEDIRDKDAIMEWINAEDRPLYVGFERFIQKPSNLQIIPEQRRSPLAPSRTMQVVDAKWALRRRKKAAASESSYRPLPGPFTPGWDWLMHGKDYPVSSLAVRAWVRPDERAAWKTATVVEYLKTSMRVRCDGSESVVLVPLDRARTVHPCHVDLEHCMDDDLSSLDELNEGVIAHRLEDRFVRRQKVFTWVSEGVLAAVNPCIELEGLFAHLGQTSSSASSSASSSKSVAPHVFALGDQAFAAATSEDLTSQSIVLTGMSGSGKSRLSEELIRYLLSTKPVVGKSEEMLKTFSAAQVALQAFGNASGVRCSDTTCFTKLMRVCLHETSTGGDGEGSKPSYVISRVFTEAYAFDKNRLLRKHPLERGFNVFYQLCNGWRDIDAFTEDFGLEKPSKYHMLGHEDATYRRHLRPRDKSSSRFRFTRASALKSTLRALDDLGLDASVQEDLMRILASLLLLSNVEFEASESLWENEESSKRRASESEVSPKAAVSGSGQSADCLERACRLLDVGHARVTQAFLFRCPHEEEDFFTALSAEQASEMRDHFIEFVYGLVFDFVLQTINVKMAAQSDSKPPSPSDLCLNVVEHPGFVFGIAGSDPEKDFAAPTCGMKGTAEASPKEFARSQWLSGEALFQNFANEVCEHIYETGMHETEKKRLPKACQDAVRSMHLQTNQELLEMFVGQPDGILSRLDEQALVRGKHALDDAEFVQTLLLLHESKRYLQRATFGYDSFRVRHYGGYFVEYDARGLIAANARPCQVSSEQFLELFDPKVSSVLAVLQKGALALVDSELEHAAIFNQRAETRTSAQRRRNEIMSLSEILESGRMWLIRCILPNLGYWPMEWDEDVATRQLDYAGFSQLCAVRDAFFPMRISESEILSRFWSIARRFDVDLSKSASVTLEMLLGEEGERWIDAGEKGDPDPIFYLSAKGHRILERCRWRIREKATIKIQHECMKLSEKVEAILKIQALVYRKILDPARIRDAAISIQNAFRLFRVRNDYLIVRGAAIRIQALARRFICRSQDVRAFSVAISIQRIWRGHAVRQRMILAGICRDQSPGVFELSHSRPIRTSLVTISSTTQGLPRVPRRKRQALVLTGRPKAELRLADPTTERLFWVVTVVPGTTAKHVEAEDDSGGSHVEVEVFIDGSKRTIVFSDNLCPKSHGAWARDIEAPPFNIDLITSSVVSLAAKFRTSLFASGSLQVRVVPSSGGRHSWKERFAALHQGQLFLIRGEEVEQTFELSAGVQIKAINVVDHMEHNFLEMTSSSGEILCLLRFAEDVLRQRWAQAIACVLHLASADKRLEQLREKQMRSVEGTSFVTHALAVECIRTSGKFSAPETLHIGAESAEGARRTDVKGRRLSKMLSAPGPLLMKEQEDVPDVEVAKSQMKRGLSPSATSKLRSASSEKLRRQRAIIRRRLQAKARALIRRETEGLYHAITSPEYSAAFCALSAHGGKGSAGSYNTVSSALLRAGDDDEAWDTFLEHASLKESILEKLVAPPLPDTEARLNDLLLFSNIAVPPRRRRRKQVALSGGAGADSEGELDGFDAGVLGEGDEDGKLLEELLQHLGMSQYMDGFRKMGCVQMRQAKQLTHADLPEFGVSGFSHQEKLIHAFRNYGRVGSAIAQPRRASQRIEELFISGPRFDDAIEVLGLEEWRTKLVERGLFTVEDLLALNKQRLSKLGVGSHHDRKHILEKLNSEGPKLREMLAQEEAIADASAARNGSISVMNRGKLDNGEGGVNDSDDEDDEDDNEDEDENDDENDDGDGDTAATAGDNDGDDEEEDDDDDDDGEDEKDTLSNHGKSATGRRRGKGDARKKSGFFAAAAAAVAAGVKARDLEALDSSGDDSTSTKRPGQVEHSVDVDDVEDDDLADTPRDIENEEPVDSLGVEADAERNAIAGAKDSGLHHRRIRSLEHMSGSAVHWVRPRSKSRSLDASETSALRHGLFPHGSSRVDTLAEETPWKCLACGRENEPGVDKCGPCGRRMGTSVNGTESLEPWVCSTCRRTNASDIMLCGNCQSSRSDASLSAAEMFPPSEFEMGDRVKLTVSNGSGLERGAAGMVTVAYKTIPECDVAFDEGIDIRVSNEHLKKIAPKQGRIERINTFFQRLVPLPRFSSFSPGGLASSSSSPSLSSSSTSSATTRSPLGRAESSPLSSHTEVGRPLSPLGRPKFSSSSARVRMGSGISFSRARSGSGVQPGPEIMSPSVASDAAVSSMSPDSVSFSSSSSTPAGPPLPARSPMGASASSNATSAETNAASSAGSSARSNREANGGSEGTDELPEGATDESGSRSGIGASSTAANSLPATSSGSERRGWSARLPFVRHRVVDGRKRSKKDGPAE